MHIRLPYPPSVNGYLIHTKRGPVRTATANEYVIDVRKIVEEEQCISFTGRLAISIDLVMPDRRVRDIDNTLKVLIDALQSAGVYKNDSQIDYIQIRRCHVEAPGAADVCIEEIEE